MINKGKTTRSIKKILIKYSAYKYAPETARASVNGVKIDMTDSNIPVLICTGHHEEARKELKKLYRKQNREQTKYIYCFYRQNSKQFYYIACLQFTAADDINTRLYCYKELKHHLQNHPQTITTESGICSPYGATPPEIKKEEIIIDFTRCSRLRIETA